MDDLSAVLVWAPFGFAYVRKVVRAKKGALVLALLVNLVGAPAALVFMIFGVRNDAIAGAIFVTTILFQYGSLAAALYHLAPDSE